MSFSPVTIFFSGALSARKDKNLFEGLRKQLLPLKLLGRIQEWYESEISPGCDWRQGVDMYLNSADIIVLLISPDFFASEYCGLEMERALERGETGVVRVISVLLHPLDIEGLPIKKIGPLLPRGGPVSLWQNKEAALLEVAKGIRKVVEELSEHVVGTFTRGSKMPVCRIPYRRNLFFTGREDLLTRLHDYFTSEQTTRPLIQALCGLGGIGKTQLATEYVYRYRQEYQTIFWIRAASQDLFREDIMVLADELAISQRERGNEQQLYASIRKWLQSHSEWLLLLDDLEDFSLIDLLVPHQSAGSLLLMTHGQATGPFAHALEIDPMTTDESAVFLLRRAKIIEEQQSQKDTNPEDYRQATEIAHAFDGFPLALDQAGAYIEETHRNLADYLALYRQRRVALLQRRGYSIDDHPQPVTITLSLAFEQVLQNDPSAMELLYLFAFFHPDAIPDEMIVQGATELEPPLQELAADPLALDDAIAILFKFSLIRRRADTTTLSIHRIVQTVLRDSLPDAQQRRWALLVVRLVNAVFPYGNFDFWSVCQRYFPQAQQCAAYITDFQIAECAAVQLLHHLGFYCYQRALYTEAEIYLTQALDISEQVLGTEHIETAQTLDDVALLLTQQGNYQRAESLRKRSLAIYEQLLGPGHTETAIILNNLALFYYEQGNYQEAEPLYLRALAIHESSEEPSQTEIATLFNNLGLLYDEQGKYQEAEAFYLRALALREAFLEPGHRDFAEIWNNLALLYQSQGKNQQAEPFLRRALDLFEQTVGPAHPDTAVALNNLALLSSEQGDDKQAEAFALRALTIYEQTPGSDLLDIARTLNTLAKFYRRQENYQRAESLMERAIAICSQVLDSKHPTTVLYMSNLAELYTSQGKYLEAEALSQHSIDLPTQIQLPEPPNTT